MSTISEIKDRLRGDGTPFCLVSGATALAQVKDRPDSLLPVAYVLSAREVSAANTRATGRVLQRMERDIMVVIVAEDLGDPTGDVVQDPLEALKAWVRARLIGFMPTDMQDPMTHVSGEVVQATGGTVWFEDIYSAPLYLKEVQ